MPVRIVCISDTHDQHNTVVVPDGDILVHAGDATSRGYKNEIEAFGSWIRKQPHTYKVVISGNHDFGYQDSPLNARDWLYGEVGYDHRDGLYYLQDESLSLDVLGQTVKIYGSPWQPWFHNWAFNLYPEQIKEKWDKIPTGLDILITHGPPYRVLDVTSHTKEHVGCRELLAAIQRTKPKLHVVGHIHEGHGVAKCHDTVVANASICTVRYKPTQGPLVFDLYEDGTITQISKE